MSVARDNSVVPRPKAPDWIHDLRASLDRESRPQQRLLQLEQLMQARDAMIDAATLRKLVELNENDLQRQKSELQQQINALQQRIDDLPKAGAAEKVRSMRIAAEPKRQLTELNTQIAELNTQLADASERLELLQAREEKRCIDYRRLQAQVKASQAAVERLDAAHAGALDQLTASGALDDVSNQQYQEAQRIWLELQDEEFIVCSGGLLDRSWMIVQSLFVPTVPVAAVLAAAAAQDAEDAVLQLYQWERDRLLTLAKGAGAAAVTVLAGLIATGFGGKTGVTSATLLVAAPLVVILLFWAGFLLTGLRGLADQYPIAREMVER